MRSIKVLLDIGAGRLSKIGLVPIPKSVLPRTDESALLPIKLDYLSNVSSSSHFSAVLKPMIEYCVFSADESGITSISCD